MGKNEKKDSGRRGNLDDCSTVLQKLLAGGKGPLSQGFTRWKLWSNWEAVVGESMARHSSPVDYHKGSLIVWVDSSARMQEMIYLVRPIRQKINDFVGRQWVRSIRFTLDRHHVPSQSEVDSGFHKVLK